MTRAPESSIELRAVGADEWRLWRELRLEALRDAPHAFSSTLAEWQGEGDTEARWRARLTSVPLNVVAYLDGLPAGMVGVAAAERQNEAELISMWIAPAARGRGVGDALIASAVAWAKRERMAALELYVVRGNERALALYRRHGFVDAPDDDDFGREGCDHRLVLHLRNSER